MTLTKEVLKRIIKEELDKLVAEMGEEEVEETEVDPIDAQIADLEQQLAEAKKAKGIKKSKMTFGTKNAPESHKMKPAKSKK
jgi:DNA primase large subunit